MSLNSTVSSRKRPCSDQSGKMFKVSDLDDSQVMENIFEDVIAKATTTLEKNQFKFSDNPEVVRSFCGAIFKVMWDSLRDMVGNDRVLNFNAEKINYGEEDMDISHGKDNMGVSISNSSETTVKLAEEIKEIKNQLSELISGLKTSGVLTQKLTEEPAARPAAASATQRPAAAAATDRPAATSSARRGSVEEAVQALKVAKQDIKVAAQQEIKRLSKLTGAETWSSVVQKNLKKKQEKGQVDPKAVEKAEERKKREEEQYEKILQDNSVVLKATEAQLRAQAAEMGWSDEDVQTIMEIHKKRLKHTGKEEKTDRAETVEAIFVELPVANFNAVRTTLQMVSGVRGICRNVRGVGPRCFEVMVDTNEKEKLLRGMQVANLSVVQKEPAVELLEIKSYPKAKETLRTLDNMLSALCGEEGKRTHDRRVRDHYEQEIQRLWPGVTVCAGARKLIGDCMNALDTKRNGKGTLVTEEAFVSGQIAIMVKNGVNRMREAVEKVAKNCADAKQQVERVSPTADEAAGGM